MIAAFFTRAWAKVWPYLAAIGAALAAVLAIRHSGKAAGKQEARIDQLEADRAAREEARNVENETASLSDDSVVRESVDRWVRDGKR